MSLDSAIDRDRVRAIGVDDDEIAVPCRVFDGLERWADQLVGELGPVSRPGRRGRRSVAECQLDRVRAIRVRGVDLAVRQVRDLAVRGRSERIRQSRPRANDGDRDEGGQQKGDHQEDRGEPWHGPQWHRVLHRDPPFREEPGGEAARAAGCARERRRASVLGLANARVGFEPGGEEPVEVGFGHALAWSCRPSFVEQRASGVGLEGVAHRGGRPMETGTDGARRNAEDLRRVIEAEPEVVMHDEHRSLIDVEASEAALELIAIGQVDVQVARSRRFRHRERVDMDLDAPAPSAAACLAIARVDQQAMEPGLETVGIAQAGEAPPGGHECLLGRILGPPFVTKDQPGDDVEPADRGRASSLNAS